MVEKAEEHPEHNYCQQVQNEVTQDYAHNQRFQVIPGLHHKLVSIASIAYLLQTHEDGEDDIVDYLSHEVLESFSLLEVILVLVAIII